MSSEISIRRDLTTEQIDLVKRTICRGASDDELFLFVQQCNRTGLDPFSRQIHAVKRWNSKTQREEMQIQVGIDGFRLIANRTGQLDGQDDVLWCGKDGKWLDVWLSNAPPSAAKVTVYRKGCSHPFSAVVRYESHVQKNKDGHPNAFWSRMPDIMLAKCAEALALRKAFPNELSGLYTPEELRETEVELLPHGSKPHQVKTPAIANGTPQSEDAVVIAARDLEEADTLQELAGVWDQIRGSKVLSMEDKTRLAKLKDERKAALQAVMA